MNAFSAVPAERVISPAIAGATPDRCATLAVGSYCGWCEPRRALDPDGTTSTGICPACLDKLRRSLVRN